MRNIEHITPNTFTQFAALVIESKLSGYSHSVCGHGRQQLGPNKAEQNRPFTTEESQIDDEKSMGVLEYAHPPSVGKRDSWRKGPGQMPCSATSVVLSDIVTRDIHGCYTRVVPIFEGNRGVIC
jgi:hypothetical protein